MRELRKALIIITILSALFLFFGMQAYASGDIRVAMVKTESFVEADGNCYRVVPQGNFISGSTPWKHLIEYTFEGGKLNVSEKMCVRIKIKLTDVSRGYVGQSISLMCKDSQNATARTVFSERIDDTAVGGWQTVEFYFTPGENATVPATDAYMIYFCVSSTDELFSADKYYMLSGAEFEKVGDLDVEFIKRDAQSGALVLQNHTDKAIAFEGVMIAARYNSDGTLLETVVTEPVNRTLEAYEGFASREAGFTEFKSGDRISVYLFNSLTELTPLEKKLDEYIN